MLLEYITDPQYGTVYRDSVLPGFPYEVQAQPGLRYYRNLCTKVRGAERARAKLLGNFMGLRRPTFEK